ncbi:MAP7 domain-containing protein [Deinococcus peraridilitoris]|uniref:Uncharacterized protein n=1 Tax=Deinococcus peraridilitoris (strain DSM 19664 / LMG 22246 / CIP 109416 / KR-200) TaxID=937777 RepID=L0A202_DEIPD|nr:MAP7 domain-containing protein [Deinococcus peraridilitoris]AFZ67187.1 hypothetical protein Deipe_1654 [Deinococcus peraridilitoris DSM 19664]
MKQNVSTSLQRPSQKSTWLVLTLITIGGAYTCSPDYWLSIVLLIAAGSLGLVTLLYARERTLPLAVTGALTAASLTLFVVSHAQVLGARHHAELDRQVAERQSLERERLRQSAEAQGLTRLRLEQAAQKEQAARQEQARQAALAQQERARQAEQTQRARAEQAEQARRLQAERAQEAQRQREEAQRREQVSAARVAAATVPTPTTVPNEEAVFRRRCLDAIASQLDVERVSRSPGGMLSPERWGPPQDNLWFWKPNVRRWDTGEVQQFTCRTSNDRGFEVFPGI